MSFILRLNNYFVSKFRNSIDYILSRSYKNAVFIPSGFWFLISSGGVIFLSLMYQGRFIFYGEVDIAISLLFFIVSGLFLLFLVFFFSYGFYSLYYDSEVRRKIYHPGNSIDHATNVRKQSFLRFLFIIVLLINAILVGILIFSFVIFFTFYHSGGTL